MCNLECERRAEVHVLIVLSRSFQAPEDLFETLSQVILNAVDFDCLGGAGATVHVMSVA